MKRDNGKKNRFFLILFCFFNLATTCQRSKKYQEESQLADDYHSYYAQKLEPQAVEMELPKKRIAVLNFWNDTSTPLAGVGRYVGDEIRHLLILSKKVLLPLEGASELNSEDFLQGSEIKVVPLIREGRRQGAAALLIGRLVKLSFTQEGDNFGFLRQKQVKGFAELEIKIFDLFTGRELLSLAQNGESKSHHLLAFGSAEVDVNSYQVELLQQAIQVALHALMPQILKVTDKLSWQGRILKINGPQIYVNAGRMSGLNPGDILKVLTAGTDLYDPLTGNYFGHSTGHMKGTLEVVNWIDPDGALARLHTGANFQEGDTVELY